MKKKINASLISTLAPGISPYEVHDTELRGFLLRVQPSGSIAFYCSYRNRQGKRNRLSLGRFPAISPAQARDHARITISKVVQGEDPAQNKKRVSSLTLDSFLTEHFSPWAVAHHRNGVASVARLRSSFSALLKLSLNELTPAQLERWRTKRLQRGIAPASINRDLASLKAACSKAVAWGHLQGSQLRHVKLTKIDKAGIVRFLSAEEDERMAAAIAKREERLRSERDSANQWRIERKYPPLADLRAQSFVDHLSPMITLSRNTGIRRGELFGLLWSDLDLINANLTVRGSASKSGNTRHIPLNSVALDVLSRWKKQSANTNGLVFPNGAGRPFDNVNKSWTALLKAAAIENFRWHDMRHDFASRLVMANVGLNDVRELLGHADTKMTLRYAHLSQEHKASAVAKLVRT